MFDRRSLVRRSRGGAREEHVYHQGWYPLALSTEVRPGALLGVDFLGSRVVVRRDASGRPVVQSGYCPHLGADLSLGELRDGQLRCVFHHWCFDEAGECTQIPNEPRIPPGARISTYPSTEAWGLVWAFSGPEALFPPPEVPGIEEGAAAFRTEHLGVASFEPWLPTSNGFDFQHVRALHGIPIPAPEAVEVGAHRMSYTLRFGDSELRGLAIGTNTFALYRRDGADVTFRLWTGTPVGPGETSCFSVVGLLAGEPTTDEQRASLERRLDGLTAYMAKLRDEDYEVLRTMRFRTGALVEADRHLAAYFKYVRGFPTAAPLAF